MSADIIDITISQKKKKLPNYSKDEQLTSNVATLVDESVCVLLEKQIVISSNLQKDYHTSDLFSWKKQEKE